MPITSVKIHPPASLRSESDRHGRRIADRDQIGISDRLRRNTQDNKLNLFSSFLFFQSILLLAWATVWQTELAGRNTILLVFSIFGVISSGPWAVTGSDY